MDELEKLIADYKPSQTAIELVKQTKIILLAGISGAGKDSIKQELLKQTDFCDIVSHTTRAPRNNNIISEIPDVDYHFIDQPTASSMIKERHFIEVKIIHDKAIYGTSISELKKVHDANKIAITDIDVQGVDEYKTMSPDVVAIFVLPPNYDVWYQRMQNRYTSINEFDTEWPRRRTSAIRELGRALEVPYYHFVLNNDLESAVKIVSSIAHESSEYYKDDEARQVARDILGKIIH
jgi:guanylate kinase